MATSTVFSNCPIEKVKLGESVCNLIKPLEEISAITSRLAEKTADPHIKEAETFIKGRIIQPIIQAIPLPLSQQSISTVKFGL